MTGWSHSAAVNVAVSRAPRLLRPAPRRAARTSNGYPAGDNTQ